MTKWMKGPRYKGGRYRQKRGFLGLGGGWRRQNSIARIFWFTTLAGVFAWAVWAGFPMDDTTLGAPDPVELRGDGRAGDHAATDGAPLPYLSNCIAVDGDTLRCCGERIRLLGIDTPEMPGHCRQGRTCVEGDPHAAKRALSAALGRRMPIERVGQDRYGRTLALIEGPQGDLSCLQLRAGHAVYRGDWDNGARLSARCPEA